MIALARIALVLILPLLALTGCQFVDVRQAGLCEETARIVFDEGSITRLSSATDRSVLHGVVTTVAVRDAAGAVASHSLVCTYGSSGPQSADQLALVKVTRDGERLDDAAMAALRASLERKGVYWMVAWIPTFGGPAGTLAPASREVMLLYFLQLVVNGLTYGAVIGLVAI